MEIIADDLEAAGEFVHETDFAYYILGGLRPEFDPISKNLNSRLDSIGLIEVRSRLLAYESKLEDYNAALSMNLGPSHSANMISSVSHTGLNSVNLVQPPTHGHVKTSGRLSLLEHHTLQSCFSDNFLYNYNMRSPVMPKSTPGIVAPNLQSYGSMSGLSNPFSYGVSTPLGSSNNISSQVPQHSIGFYVHNGVTHFGAPLSASVGMNSTGYPFMPHT
ncbi:hypothetical protein FEM48_Zijuj09G0210300 [Ziziphus jujuba var. spinosa]|uniref:Uncharacterized protein n=1 Tax=Ziziphus jujuba var. spinosa TaxID=714518 RepID=A0A978UVA8_ZIZJJ|nr:hypothetical protein FEM48_Zijuj09G0210300 [Ziziphus jujuba var. spinosa]